MNFSIISINDKRKSNIEKIVEAIGSPPEKLHSFNGNKTQDIVIFKSLHPELCIDLYATEPRVPVNKDRRNGEIGCWMSHYHRWKHIVKNNLEDLVIFEDDCYVDKEFLERVPCVVKNIDFVLLGNWTESVFVNKKAATMLVEMSKEHIKYGPVDEFLMSLIRVTGMRLNNWYVPVCGKLPITRQLIEKYESDIQKSN